MANTVYGPFAAINVVNGTTPANATWGNNVQTQASVALNSFNGDLVGPFIHSGMVATRDGGNLKQLNVTSGRAYVTVSDGSTALITTVASVANQFLTSTPSTIYYLFLCNDGTWQWGTTSTGPANSLDIAHASTDGSGNISAVGDHRKLGAPFFPTASVARAPVVVASVINQHITSTGNQTLINVILPSTGLYRASAYVSFLNTSPEKISLKLNWLGANGEGNPVQPFMALAGGTGVAGEFLDGTQANACTPTVAVPFAPYVFYALGGGSNTVAVIYNDPGGAPNDYVTVVIEQLF